MKIQTGNTIFIGFTSTVGGAGTSSTAVVFSRITAKLWGKKLLLISFDGISSKMSPVCGAGGFVKEIFVSLRSGGDAGKLLETAARDEFNVSYLTDAGYFNPLPELSADDLNYCMDKISSCGIFDIVVLDFPFRGIRAVEWSSLCEKVVFCTGRSVSGKADKDGFCRSMELFTAEMPEKPSFLFFTPGEDPESFSEGIVDIHGQFGAEVRELASELLEM